MSTEYGFRCRTHNPPLSSSHNLPRYAAESLLAKRSEVEILRAWSADMLISLGGGGGVNYDVGAMVEWLADHPRCDVVIEDEYGRLLDEQKPTVSQLGDR